MSGATRITTAAGVFINLLALAACQGNTVEPPATEAPPRVSVTVAPVVRATMHAYVSGWGTVEPEPASDGRQAASAHVASPVSGLISAVLLSEGQRVTEGATLFRLDSRVADVAVERATLAVRFAQQLVQRQEQLGPGQATSQKAYQEATAQLTLAESELRSAQLQRRWLDVTAPINGTIVKMSARLGDAIDPSTVLADVIDLQRLVVTASIRSVDIAQVKRGQRLEFSMGALRGTQTGGAPTPSESGVIDYIGPQVDTASDSVVIRARIPAGTALRSGQFVNVRVATQVRPDRLVVPVESIVQGEGGSEVAVVNGDTAVKTLVTTGLRESGLVEVEGEGVREGASVVVQGAYGLPASSKITVIGR